MRHLYLICVIHCIKYAKIRVFSRLSLPFSRKHGVSKNPYSRISYAVYSSLICNFDIKVVGFSPYSDSSHPNFRNEKNIVALVFGEPLERSC